MSMPTLATMLVKRAEMRAGYAHVRALRKTAMASELAEAQALARAVYALTTAYMRAHSQGLLEEFRCWEAKLQHYVNTGDLPTDDMPEISAQPQPAFAGG